MIRAYKAPPSPAGPKAVGYRWTCWTSSDRSPLRRPKFPLAISRRSAPTTSAACCARPSSRMPGPRSRRARSTREALRERRGRGDPRRDRAAARGGTADGHRRRVPPHLLAHGLHLLAGRDRAVRGRERSTSISTATTASTTTARRRCASPQRSRCRETIFADAFSFLREHAHADQTPKLTIPSPSMVHYRGGNSSIDPSVYPEHGPRSGMT